MYINILSYSAFKILFPENAYTSFSDKYLPEIKINI